MTQRAGIYGRNSKGEAKSISDQLALGRKAVDQHGWALAGEYSDDSSASLYRQKDRADWSRLLVDLASGRLDVLVLWKPARGSRDEVDWFPLLRMCADRGVRIHVVADDRTYDPSNDRDWRTLADEGVTAAYYSRQLSKDVRRGVAASAADGIPHGRSPFGYDRAFTPAGRPTRAPNEQAPIVREVFARLAKLTPISALERDLARREVFMPDGKPLRRNTIRIIATNPAYIGIRRHAGEDRPGNWPALVDEETFWRVQQILGEPGRKTTKPGAAKHLLSYLGRGQCGKHLRRQAGRRSGPDVYQCEDGCVSLRMSEADEIVERAILARLRQGDVRAMFARADDRIVAASAEAARYRVQLEEARKSFESPDGISAEALARKERALLPLIEDADRRTRPAGTAGLVDDLMQADDPERVWRGWEVAARREVVGMFAQVVLGPPTKHLGKFADPVVRLTEAWDRLVGSTWVGGGTWAGSDSHTAPL